MILYHDSPRKQQEMQMIKLTMLVKRLPTITYAQFDLYWVKHHAQLVASVQNALDIARYVQTIPHTYPELDKMIQNGRKTQDFEFDGMAEIWWKSLESMQRNRQSPEALTALNALLEDEKRFINHSQSLAWYATERQIITNH